MKECLGGVEAGSRVLEMGEMQSSHGEERVEDEFVAEAVLGSQDSPYCLS